MIIGIDDGKLLDFVFLQNLGSCGQVGLLMRHDEVFAGHHLVDFLVEPAFEAQVAIGDDAHESVFIVHYGDASDVIVAHHFECVSHGASSADGYGVVNHSVLGPFHHGHLVCLFLNRHILMNHAYASFPCNGNGHGGFGDSIHGSRYERDVEMDIP